MLGWQCVQTQLPWMAESDSHEGRACGRLAGGCLRVCHCWHLHEVFAVLCLLLCPRLPGSTCAWLGGMAQLPSQGFLLLRSQDGHCGTFTCKDFLVRTLGQSLRWPWDPATGRTGMVTSFSWKMYRAAENPVCAQC